LNLIAGAGGRRLRTEASFFHVPISDTYFIQSLLQSTQPGPEGLQWASKESEGFRAALNGVQLDLDSIPTRAGPRLYLTLTRDQQRVFIEEPVNTGLIFEGYQSEGQRELAGLMRELFCAVVEQCSEREQRFGANPVREALFRRVLFGEGSEQIMPAYR
jgi:hypothetical protein